MKRKGKRLLAFLMAAIMCLSCLQMIVMANGEAEASGTCGDDLIWTLGNDGTLTISGTGDMDDYDYNTTDKSPWYEYRNEITAAVIKEGVTSIGEDAFRNHVSLTGVEIPDSLTLIGYSAFSGCESLSEIYVPESVTIENRAFLGCTSLADDEGFVIVNGCLFDYAGDEESVVIPEGVSSIGQQAFENLTNVTSVILPDSIVSIGPYAFGGCTGLTEIKIPEGLVIIDSWAFDDCTSLTSISLPNSLTQIMPGAFYHSGLIEITIPGNVNEISYQTFMNCTNLVSVDIPNNVTCIDASAFYQCSSLSSIEIPDSVTEIGAYAFYKCTSLKSIRIPDSVTTVWHHAFAGCSSLNSVTFSSAMTEIASETFRECTALTSIEIPGYITSIGEQAFYKCSGLVSISLADGVETIDAHAFQYCSGLTTVVMPASIVRIGKRAFYSCDGLSDVYYAGSESEWNNVGIGNENECLTSATIHYNYKPFELNTYRADKLLDSTLPLGTTMTDSIDVATPCALYVSALQQAGFTGYAAAWETLTDMFDTVDDLSNGFDLAVEDSDLYTAVVLNVLEVATEYNVVNIDEYFKIPKSTLSEFLTLAKADYNIDIGLDKSTMSMTDAELEKLQEATKEYFEKTYDDAVTVNKLFSNIGTALEIADDVESYVEKCAAMYAILEMDKSLVAVVEEMYELCPSSNLNLKLALKDCVDIVNSTVEELEDRIFSGAISLIGYESSKIATDFFWDICKEAVLNVGFPAVEIIMAGYKTGKFISNALFSTDSTIEQYCRMTVILEVEDLMQNVYNELLSEYQTNQDSASAAAWLASIDVIYSARDYDCQCAYEFVEVLDDAFANKVGEFFDSSEADTREGIKSAIDSIQRDYASSRETVLTGWISYLEVDYPNTGLYENYYSLYAESLERLRTKKYVSACPVDVYVYDEDDVLVAYVVNNISWCSTDEALAVVVEGDVKTVYVYSDEEYRVVYVGNDTGSMNLTISEYDGDEAEQKTVYFYDVALEEGKTWNLEVTEEIQEDVTYTTYQLSGEDDTLASDLDTDTTESEQNTVTMVSGSMIINGEQYFETTAYPDERIRIYACVPDGYEFVCWTSDAGDSVFSDASAQVTDLRMPSENITVTAVFKKIEFSFTRFAADAGKIAYSAIELLTGSRDAEQISFSLKGEYEEAREIELDSLESIAGDKALLLQADAFDNLILAAQTMLESSADDKTESITAVFAVTNGADGVIVYGYNGDVTGDGAVNASDTLAILRGVSGRTSLDEVEKGFADVNLDGAVNSNDLLAVVKYVSGRTSSLN